jgi:hypothetical protein
MTKQQLLDRIVEVVDVTRRRLTTGPNMRALLSEMVETTVAPVPFSFSSLIQVNDSSAILSGPFDLLDFEFNTTAGEFDVTGFVFPLSIHRGSFLGSIGISVEASEIFDVDIKLTTIDTTQCASVVSVELNDDVVAGQSYTVAITATGDGHTVTRTFTINIAA